MKPPPRSPDEPDRLKALWSYDVLDTEAEEPYDQTTALASLICGAPFSLITLVDGNRQWFKSRFGWAVKESERAISFCAHAIHEADIMVVPDATKDDRFRDNPDVTGGAGIRFYAGAPLINPEGYALGTLCVVDRVPRDLTPDQKQALRVLRTHVMTLLELRRSKRRLFLSDEILNSLPGVFYIFNQEGRFLRWNRRFEEVTGCTSEEFAKHHPLDFFRGQDRELIGERIGKVFEEGAADAEAEIVARDGTAVAHYFTGRALELEGETCLIGMGVDIGRRRELEVERERLFNVSPDPLCILGFDGLFRDVNPSWERVLGYSREELLGRSFLEFLHPDDRDSSLKPFEEARKGVRIHGFENRYLHRDGGWRWFSWTSNVDLERCVVYGLARDVTKDKEVAEALRQSEERYRSLVESAQDAILTLSSDGTITSANPEFETITGWQRELWIGRPYKDLLHPDDLPLAMEVLGKLERDEAMLMVEVRVIGKAGVEIPVEVKASRITIKEGELQILLVARDVRQRKDLDDRILRINRLDAGGRLAAGVAHDFNNLLMVIQGNTDLLLADRTLSEDTARGLRQIRDAGNRGAALVQRLMGLTRMPETQFKAVEVNQVVEGFTSMLDRLLKKSFETVLDLCPDPTKVQADSGMLEQVLMNLVVNARDAMPDGGVLTITTRQCKVDEQMARAYRAAHAGLYIRLSVKDTGTGIPLKDQVRIFEPLFTTKKEGEGTGLGLATVHIILQQHGGWVDLESELGAGATFHVYLPALSDNT
jgi:PAS domain S-box-containing protein